MGAVSYLRKDFAALICFVDNFKSNVCKSKKPLVKYHLELWKTENCLTFPTVDNENNSKLQPRQRIYMGDNNSIRKKHRCLSCTRI